LSPTVFRWKGYRFFFFSREEERMHIHVDSEKGEAKFWMEPAVAVATSYGFSERELQAIITILREREDEIRSSWRTHFSR
jgi:hypothetical protein